MSDTLQKNWYPDFIEDCRHILEDWAASVIEAHFIKNEATIKTKWTLGDKVSGVLEKTSIRKIAKDLGVSHTELSNCVQFAVKYPELEKFLEKVAEQKSLTWHTVCHKYLPSGEREEPEYQTCPYCNSKVRKGTIKTAI